MARISELINQPESRRVIRYGIIGVGANSLLYGLYLFFTILANINPLTSTTVVYIAGILLTYLGNSIWAFESKKPHAHSAPRYLAVYLLGYATQASLLHILTTILFIPHYLAQLFAMGCAAGTIFLLLNFWVFGRGRQP